MPSIMVTPTRLAVRVHRTDELGPTHWLDIDMGDTRLTMHGLTLDEICGLADRIKAECEALKAEK